MKNKRLLSLATAILLLISACCTGISGVTAGAESSTERPISFISIAKAPTKRYYLQGQSLDLTGGKLAVLYEDNGYELINITSDMLSGYDSQKIGTQIITVTYMNSTAEFSVEVYMKGDIDGDGKAAATDIALLRKHLLNDTPANGKYDVNGDGSVDILDLLSIKKLWAENPDNITPISEKAGKWIMTSVSGDTLSQVYIKAYKMSGFSFAKYKAWDSLSDEIKNNANQDDIITYNGVKYLTMIADGFDLTITEDNKTVKVTDGSIRLILSRTGENALTVTEVQNIPSYFPTVAVGDIFNFTAE